MDFEADATLRAAVPAVAGAVADLATYPSWLSVVRRAEPAPGAAGDPGPAWSVEIGARVGPFIRSKEIRMVRVEATGEGVRFERRELDDGDHSPWVLQAGITVAGEGTRLSMHLHYGGGAWLSVLTPILAAEVGRAAGRLDALLA